ncbi:MAG: hypothetical protein R2941_04950 [Desulfobacterales bacterium]
MTVDPDSEGGAYPCAAILSVRSSQKLEYLGSRVFWIFQTLLTFVWRQDINIDLSRNVLNPVNRLSPVTQTQRKNPAVF